MKRVSFIILTLLWALHAMAQSDSKRVLFIGNSYTEVNNLPQLLSQVAESAGDHVDYQGNTPGGCTFSQHCNNASMDLIRRGQWDVVVLQEQSQMPSFPQAQVEREVFPFAAQLVEAVYAANPDGEAMFYMTWGRKNGDRDNAAFFPVLGTYEGMDSMLYERYLYMARTNDASVCPVGRVWRYLRANNPEIELYQPDESHPSLAGSYAAACAFYTMVFHKSPQLITYDSELDASVAQTIRDAVQRVVFDTLAFWLRQGDSKRVLFIGNSYTEVNNLPQLVSKVAASVGDHVDYQGNTPGGCTFSQHCSNGSMDLIRQGQWDVVVLQEQSQLPSFPQAQVERELFPFAAQLVEAVYAANPDGEAMFYMTWGRKNGDERNAAYFPVLGTYEGMDSMLYERYLYMARTNDASVCPVGRVWRYLRANNPEIELYQPDESHPSLAGSYAAACAFYTMIFHKSPQPITYDSELDASVARTIRDAVRQVVFDTLSFWLRQAEDTTHQDTTQLGIGSMNRMLQGCRVYPNPTQSYLTIELPDSMGTVEAVLSDVKGCRVRSFVLSSRISTASLSDIPRGVYLLTMVADGDMVTTYVIKQ